MERTPRTNLFVLATLVMGTVSTPVRVRNIARNGALIEGPSIPAAGTQVRLRRGHLDVPARIIWSQSGRSGLSFEESVPVTAWLPNQAANAPQQSDNRIAGQFQHAHGTTGEGDNGDSDPAGVSLEDIEALVHGLESLAGELSADKALVERHGAKLETLGVAARLVRKLALLPSPGAR